MTECITENMNKDGYDGEWYSYISNITMYRVRLLDGEFTIWRTDNGTQQLINTPEVMAILKHVKERLSENN